MIIRACLLPLLIIFFASALCAETRSSEDDSETTEESDEAAPNSDIASAQLVASTGKPTTFGEAFGDGYKVVLFTKPWSDTNAQLIGELSHFRIRLNRDQLKSGVVFLRADLAAASRVMAEYKGRVRYTLDPDGHAARMLKVKSVPSLMLIGPQGSVLYTTPLLARELVKQVAAHYKTPEKLFNSPRPTAAPSRRPGIPPAAGNSGQFTVR